MKTLLARGFLSFSIIVMAAFIGHRVISHMEARSQATASVPFEEQQGANAWIEGFSYNQTRAGATKWVVTADQAKVFEEEHMAKLQRVNVRLFNQDFQKEQMTITAENGVMDTASNDFELMSQEQKTIMTLEPGYQVFSNTLRWEEKAQRIHTDDFVVIQGKGMVITGKGLIGDAEKHEFHLLNNVRAEVSAP